MDDVVKSLKDCKIIEVKSEPAPRPTREEAEAAVRTLLRWAGDDPTREGLLETPKRVVKAYEEHTRNRTTFVQTRRTRYPRR